MSMQYRVRFARVGEAQVQEELVESTDEATLRSVMNERGQTLLSVRAVPPTQRAGRTSAASDFPMFCREIRTLLRAGMTLVEAVATLAAKDRADRRASGLAAGLLTLLERGLSLSAALGSIAGAPPVLIAAVRAGERTSNLAESLDDYLRFDDLVSQLRRKITSAAIYPALVTAIGIAISCFLLLVVMPSFAGMYANLRGSATGSVGLVITLSDWIGHHRADIVIGAGLLVTMFTVWVVTGGAKRSILGLAMSIPWVARRLLDFRLAMMYQALALLLRGGYPMTQSLRIAAESALSPELALALSRAELQISQGTAVSQALFSCGLSDEVDRRLMFAAERNGDFHMVADVVSRMHGDRFELFVERVSRVAEPVLLLLVATMVGGIVIAMYLPVFSLGAQLR